MVPYYILVAAPFLAVILQYFFRKKYNIDGEKKNVAIAVFFAIYFLLVALRHETVGADTWNYIRWFDYTGNISWSNFVETYIDRDIGYYFLNKAVSVFTGEVQILFIIIAFISIYPVAKLYYNESENALISISLFLILPVFMMNFSGLRQGIAIGLGVYAYYAAKEKKPFKFILTVLFATLFHSSALILILIYPLYHMNIKRAHLLFIAPVFLVVNIFRRQFFLGIASVLSGAFGEEQVELSETNTYMMLVLFALFIIYSFFVPNEELIDDDTRAMRNFLVFVTFIQIFASVHQLAMRLNYYYLIFIPLLIPKITNRWVKIDPRLKLLVKMVIGIYFVYYYFTGPVANDSLQIYPYMFFWE